MVLTPPLFIEIPVPEDYAVTCVTIPIPPVSTNYLNGFWNCSDRVVFFLHFIQDEPEQMARFNMWMRLVGKNIIELMVYNNCHYEKIENN